MTGQLELTSQPQVLAALDRLEQDVRNAQSFTKLNSIAAQAAAIQKFFGPVKDVSDRAGEVWIEAEVRLAEELGKLPKATGTRSQAIPAGPGRGRKGKTGLVISTEPVFKPDTGVSEMRAKRAKKLNATSPKKRKQIVAKLKSDGKGVTPAAVLSELRKEAKVEKIHQVATAAFSATGPFDVVVIDPPWPMQKIDRDVRPNQDVFDYQTMTEDELAVFWPAKMADKLSKDCHVFCWTTHKFLPEAIRLVEKWGGKYVLLMVWHKPGGFQPVGLPQYNCEFIVYARIGSPVFIDTTDFPVCFEAPRREHSRKPDAFYDLIRRVTGGSRIDVFSREAREGFAQFGNETGKFTDPVQRKDTSRAETMGNR